MQQQSLTPEDGAQQQEPDWVLATYGQRAGAWALDFAGFGLPLTLLIIGIVVLVLGIVFSEEFWLLGALFSSVGVVVMITVGVVLIGYIVWWLIVLGRGQTPGKQIVGIRVIKDNGEPSGWGYTFLREFVIKALLVGFLSDATFGIARLVDYLWPLWDKAEKMQTLHDKLLGTLVVRNR
jgi:uncharacterized RDD family membrane protein YckC